MLTVPKFFSILVASGNGQKCNELKRQLGNVLTCENALVFKFKSKENPKLINKLCSDISKNVSYLYDGMDEIYFCNDLKDKS